MKSRTCDVPTYDHKPEMSAHSLTEKLVERIAEGDYNFILVNFASPDMVGHTGVLGAAVKAVETVDRCLARAIDALFEAGGQALITAAVAKGAGARLTTTLLERTRHAQSLRRVSSAESLG